jgi:acyl-CoA synthetase (AMP-forming)/AMP-acid ligase II
MPVYGLSEAALAVTFCPPGRPPLVVGGAVSVGLPVPGVEVEVRGEEGGVLPERRMGRIHVRGPSLMQGYLGDPAATAGALRGGWLDTGDLGFHAGGELFVHGRAKDIVIVRGANHAPEEFEACLGAIEGLRPGCAVALGFVPEGGDGEQLLVLAERAAAFRGDRAALVEAVRDAVSSRSGVRPHTVVILEPGTLPRTSSGKMRRGEALRRFQSGKLRPPRKVNVISVVREMIAGRLARARARDPR